MQASATPSPLPVGSSPAVERAEVAVWVRREFGFVWRSLRRFGLAPADADDAAQQVFLIFSSKLPNIEPGSERAFLFGTAFRIASRARRSRQRRRENLEETFDVLLGTGLNPEQALEQRQASELLNAVLEALPDDLRAAFILSEIEQLTRVEIAELLCVPQGTVASRLRRAREQYDAAIVRLRKRMQSRGVE
jgi:RNA polymerase sigma-70 factor (ECF subfamily)